MTESVGVPSQTEAGLDVLQARLEREEAAEVAAVRPAGPVNFEPFLDYVLIERVKAPEEVKVGSILIPEQAHEKPLEADVIAVGKGRPGYDGVIIPMLVKVGDRILIGKWSGTEVKIDGYPFLIVKQDEILGRRL